MSNRFVQLRESGDSNLYEWDKKKFLELQNSVMSTLVVYHLLEPGLRKKREEDFFVVKVN